MLSRVKPKPEPVCKQQKRFIAIKYLNNKSNLLKPETILNSREVRAAGLTKAKIRDFVFSRALPKTLGSLVLNYSRFLKELTEEELKSILGNACECHKVDDPDIKQDGHIVTGDTGWIGSDEVTKLLGRGSKYRPSTRVPTDAVIEETLHGIRLFISQLLRKQEITTEIAEQIYSKSIQKCQTFRDRIDGMDKTKDFNAKIREEGEALRIIREIQNGYVFTPVDKAASNFALNCKKGYLVRLCREMGVDTTADADGRLGIRGNLTYHHNPQFTFDEMLTSHQAFQTYFLGTEVREENKVAPTIWFSYKFHKIPTGTRFIAGAKRSTTKELAVLLTKVLTLLKEHWTNYCKVVGESKGVNLNWSIKNSQEVTKMLSRSRAGLNGKVEVADFSTLFTALEHELIITKMSEMVAICFKNAKQKYISVGNKAYYHSDEKRGGKKYSQLDVVDMVKVITEHSYVRFAGRLFRQTKGISMGASCSPVIADLVLSKLEFDFLTRPENYEYAKRLKLTCRYIDDILSVGTDALRVCHDRIYPPSLPLNFDSNITGNAHFLDLDIDTQNGNRTVFDKKKNF